MAMISITRTNEFTNRYRDYRIFIDGRFAGVIANGETKDFATTAGTHTVIAKIDWCSSEEITVHFSNGETKDFAVGGNKKAGLLTRISGAAISLHFLAKLLFDIDFLIVLVIPALFLLFYYITWGRKKYLSLAEKL